MDLEGSLQPQYIQKDVIQVTCTKFICGEKKVDRGFKVSQREYIVLSNAMQVMNQMIGKLPRRS